MSIPGDRHGAGRLHRLDAGLPGETKSRLSRPPRQSTTLSEPSRCFRVQIHPHTARLCKFPPHSTLLLSSALLPPCERASVRASGWCGGGGPRRFPWQVRPEQECLTAQNLSRRLDLENPARRHLLANGAIGSFVRRHSGVCQRAEMHIGRRATVVVSVASGCDEGGAP